MRSRSPSAIWVRVGLMMSSPSTRPTRTAAIGMSNGIDEQYSAVDAPVMLSTSGMISGSAESTLPMTWVS